MRTFLDVDEFAEYLQTHGNDLERELAQGFLEASEDVEGLLVYEAAFDGIERACPREEQGPDKWRVAEYVIDRLSEIDAVHDLLGCNMDADSEVKRLLDTLQDIKDTLEKLGEFEIADFEDMVSVIVDLCAYSKASQPVYDL